MIVFSWYHGLKLGFEYIPEIENGAVILEVLCFRLMFIFLIKDDPTGTA
jgi:hypothetical protein